MAKKVKRKRFTHIIKSERCGGLSKCERGMERKVIQSIPRFKTKKKKIRAIVRFSATRKIC